MHNLDVALLEMSFKLNTKLVVKGHRQVPDTKLRGLIKHEFVNFSVRYYCFYCLPSSTDIKQLLDEVEHDIMNYQNRGLCYLPKPKEDNTDTRV